MDTKDTKRKGNGLTETMGAVMPMSSCTLPMIECDADAVSSSSSGRPRVPKTIANDRYKISGKLGSGSYSDVYLAIDSETGDQLAAKFEWKHAEKTGKLLAEAQLCQTFTDGRNGNGKSVPFVRWVGTHGEYNIMVMDVLGPSLEDMMEKCGGSFSLRTVLMMGEQMVSLLEYVHQHGIIHRDIKPNNFLIGVGDQRDRVYIVDFGLARRYIEPDTNKHIPNRAKKGLTGTVRYTTKNIHDGQEPARRDDLGSVGYVLMYLALGRLPWQGITAKSKKTKQRRIGRRKERVSHEELCTGFPEEMKKYLEYCDALGYDEQPDYEYLRSLMRAALARDIETTGGPPIFDWLLPTDQRPDPMPQAKRKSKPGLDSVPVPELPPPVLDVPQALLTDMDMKRRKLEDGRQAQDTAATAANTASPAATFAAVVQANAEANETSYESYEYETEYSELESEEEEEESESERTELEEDEDDDMGDNKDKSKTEKKASRK